MIDGSTSFGLPLRIYLLSQALRPLEVRQILVNAALTDGWMPLVVNMNMSIFVGMIALTAGFGATASLLFLSIHLTVTTLAMVIYLMLALRRQKGCEATLRMTELGLCFNDAMVMLGWVAGLWLFWNPTEENRSLLLVLLLAVAGIASAALNAKTLTSLLAGRLALFGVPFVFVAITQPDLWPLLLATLLVSAAVSVGIGYAVHVQLLNESNLVLRLRDTNVLLEQSGRQEKQVQDQLLKEAQFRENFLHSINHDLAQPLSGLDMCLYTMTQAGVPAAADGPLTTARKCLSTAKSLIRDVSDVASQRGQQPQPMISAVALWPIITSVVEELQPNATAKALSLRAVSTSAVVMADENMLRRVLRNLAFNALEYTSEGGVLLGVRRRCDMTGIAVVDTGAGIPLDHQERVFEAFYRHEQRTSGQSLRIGLGLAIVRDLVSAMNGNVTLRSAVGRGATFEVRLPVAPRAKGSNDVRSGRLLLAEDQPEQRSQLTHMIRSYGFDVIAPLDLKALQALTVQPLDCFDLLVLDLILGENLTALDILRAASPAVRARTLVISDYADPGVLEVLEQMGVPFQTKPLNALSFAAWAGFPRAYSANSLQR